MTVKPGVQTIEDLLALPDDGKRYEIHDGVIVDVGTSSLKHSLLGGLFVEVLRRYVREHHIGGIVTGADGTYKLDKKNIRVPDAAYLSSASVAKLKPGTVFCPFAPDLAVEIKSPSNTSDEMRDLADLYLRTGSRMVWTVDPEAKLVRVYRRRGEDPLELGKQAMLGGYDVLPEFQLNLADVFAEIEHL